MVETVMRALELLKTDESVNDVLSTVCATVSSLSDKLLSPVEYIALGIVIKEAEKKIQDIIKVKQ